LYLNPYFSTYPTLFCCLREGQRLYLNLFMSTLSYFYTTV